VLVSNMLLDVLASSRHERPRPIVRTALDPSMSFSFQVPSSMRNRPQPRVVLPLPAATIVATHDELSWEDRDWTAPVQQRVAPTRTDTCSRSNTSLVEWEEADVPDLPDEFPVLLVNLTRLHKEHFQSSTLSAHTIPFETEQEVRDFYSMVKHTLHAHFTHLTKYYLINVRDRRPPVLE
jgi:hypothetical protein